MSPLRFLQFGHASPFFVVMGSNIAGGDVTVVGVVPVAGICCVQDGEEGVLFFASCLSNVTIDHASLSKQIRRGRGCCGSRFVFQAFVKSW